jgi:two-component system OmpR family response regulator
MLPPIVLHSGIRTRNAAPAKSPATTRVLVVDDDPLIVEVVSALLRHEGFAVDTTTNSTEALARLAADPAKFDALVSDHDMPLLCGSELIDRARAAGFRGKVILHSGSVSGADAAEKVRRADAVLAKPFGVRALVPTLRALVMCDA